MKKLLIILTASVFALSACENENLPNPKVNGESQVVKVQYATITLNGAPIVSTSVGTGTYVDPGATAFDSITGTSTTLTPVSNNVDLTTEGFYSVKYTAKNAYGYVSSATRLVLVTTADPTVDISGGYARTSNGCPVNVTKRGPGLYTTDNVGGVPNNPPYIFDVYFGFVNDSTIEVPVQPNALGGDIYCDNTTFLMDATDTSFAWVVRGSGFGTALRTFSHQ